jgi:glycosyltransferase involved in cell wall biosynthesis
MNILLIAPHFCPDEHIGAARWNRLSKYMLRDGHGIYVIASDIISDSTDSKRSTKLVRVNYQSSGVDKALMTFSKVKKGLPVEKNRQTFQVDKYSAFTSVYSYFIKLAGKIVRFPGVYWWSTADTVQEGIEIIKSEKIDVIVATFPFSVSIKAAHELSSQTRVPWIADMRDGWSSYYFGEYDKGTVLYSLLKKLECYYLSSAAAVVTINQTLADSLCVNKDKIVIIPNIYDPEEQEFIKTDQEEGKSNTAKVVFSFAGSVHDNHCWEIFFEGISKVGGEFDMQNIEVNYYGGYFDKLTQKRNRYHVPESIMVDHGYVEKVELMPAMSKADILLVFGFSGAFGDSVTTGKIFDYIEIGKPVLVFGPQTSELAKLVKKTGIGLVISDSETAKEVILTIAKDKVAFESTIKAQLNTQEIAKYSALDSSRFFVDTINRVIS